jgi:hypothetical protein
MPQAKKPKQMKWPGELGVPIAKMSVPLAKHYQPDMTPAELDNWINQDVESQRREKLRALLKHYKILGQTALAWRELALCLALAHVPGFKLAEDMPKPQGNPGRWTKAAGAQLVAEVAALRESMKINTS